MGGERAEGGGGGQNLAGDLGAFLGSSFHSEHFEYSQTPGGGTISFCQSPQLGGNGGQWGGMGGNWACACACAYVSPFSEGGDLPAPLVCSLSVRSYIAN